MTLLVTVARKPSPCALSTSPGVCQDHTPSPSHLCRTPCDTSSVHRIPSKEFVYFDDDGDLVALRYENWKVVFEEQRAQGTLRIWAEPFTKLRTPKIFDLRSDPYERADITSNTYYDWLMSDGAGVFIAAPRVVGEFLATFKEFPPSQRPSSFSIDQMVEKMQRSLQGTQ
jgi:hypothetical protein